MPSYGKYTRLPDVKDPTSVTALNDMLQYLFSKVQGGIEYKEAGPTLQADIDSFREPVWQRNMVVNSDFACVSRKNDLAMCYTPDTSAEGDSVTVEDDPVSPGRKRLALHAVAESNSVRVEYDPELPLFNIDPTGAVAAGYTDFMLVFYHAGDACDVEVRDITNNACFTLTYEGDNWAEIDGWKYIAPHTGLKRFVLSFDVTEFGNCSSIGFCFTAYGFEYVKWEPQESTVYVCAPQIVVDKYGGRAPVYTPGPHSVPRMDGLPEDMALRVHHAIDIITDGYNTRLPVIGSFENKDLTPLGAFTIPKIPPGGVLDVAPIKNLLLARVDSNAPVGIELIVSEGHPYSGGTRYGGGYIYLYCETAETMPTTFYPTHPVTMFTFPQQIVTGDVTMHVYGFFYGHEAATVTFGGGVYELEYDAYGLEAAE